MNRHREDIVRVKSLKDDEVIGSGPAMMSASGKPIGLNDVLYAKAKVPHTGYSSNVIDEDEDDEEETEDDDSPVEAFRVLQLNYRERYVRIRCVRGCESTITFGGESCSRKTYYHTFKEAMAEVLAELSDRKGNAVYELAKANKRWKGEQVNIEAAIKDVSRLKEVQVPAAV